MIIIQCSCSDSQKENENIESIDFSIKNTKEQPSEILETKFIKLSSTDNILGIARLVKQYENYIYILDIAQNTLCVYDNNWKYVCNVGKAGRGPGEYIMANNFFIDKDNKYIGIIDNHSQKINKYSLNNSYKFISSVELKNYIGTATVAPNGNIITSNMDPRNKINNDNFMVFNQEMRLLNSFEEKTFISGYTIMSMNSIYQNDNDIFAYNQYSPIVYKVDEAEATPQLEITFGDYEFIPKSFYEEIGEENSELFTILKESYYVTFYSITNNCGDFAIEYYHKDKRDIGFSDKTLKKTFTYNSAYFTDNLKIADYTFIAGSANGYYIMPLNASLVMDSENLNPELQKIINDGVNENDILLFMFKLKHK